MTTAAQTNLPNNLPGGLAVNLNPFSPLPPADPNALAIGESTYPRTDAGASIALSSGEIRFAFFTAAKTETINQVRMQSYSTAAGATPSLIRVGIYTIDGAGNLTLAAATANDTTLLAATFTLYTKALIAPWKKVAGQRYAAGILVVTNAAPPTVSAAGGTLTNEYLTAPILAGRTSGNNDLPPTVPAGSLLPGGTMPYLAFTP